MNKYIVNDGFVDILKAKESNVFHQPYEVPATTALVGCTKEDKQSNLHQLQRPVFLFVGGIIPRKGLHLLLEACVVLQKQGYRNYTLLVVGDGAQRQELEAFSQTHELADCVKWAGRVNYGNLGRRRRSGRAAPRSGPTPAAPVRAAAAGGTG